jgi:hypothetical protein
MGTGDRELPTARPLNHGDRPPSNGNRRPPSNHQSIYNRSAITNGSNLLPGVHRGSQWARRFRDVIASYASDQGGEDNLSEARRSIIRRCACLQVELERLEVRFALASGAEPGDLDLYQRAEGNLRRLLDALGMDRQPKDITPSLSDYIASKEAVDA